MTLRELRLWHWRKVLSYRKTAGTYAKQATDWEAKWPGKSCRYHRNQERKADQRANWHLGAVQTLNDHFPMGDTAERDAEREDAAKATRR